MAIKEISAKIATSLDASVTDVIGSMLNTKAAAVGDPGQTEKIASVSNDVVAWIDFSGASTSCLAIRASAAASNKMAAQVMGDGIGPDEENEVLKELTNMFAGPLEKVFAEAGAKCQRGVPNIARGAPPNSPAASQAAFLTRAYAMPAVGQFFIITVHEA